MARQIKLTRHMIMTAEDFGADTSESKILLARAEAAMAGGELEKTERLSIQARESAMYAVGKGN